jgi:hypothetical protein
MPEVIWAYTPDPIEEAYLPGSTEIGSSALIATPAKKTFRLQSRRHTEITPAQGPDGESNEA